MSVLITFEGKDGGRHPAGEGFLQIRDVDVDEIPQVGNIAVIVAIVSIFSPVVHLLVDTPFLEVLCLRLPDGCAQAVDMI